MNNRPPFAWVGLAVLVLLPGCMGANSIAPPRDMLGPDRVRLADDLGLNGGEWPEAAWWKRYGDPQLDALIEKALRDSPAMASAQIAIAQAQAQTEMLRGGLRPQLEFIGMIDRERASASGFLGPYARNLPQLGMTGPWYTAATVGFAGSLSIDLWGRDRKALAAAVGRRNARVAEASAVDLAITTEIAQLYFAMQAGYGMLDLLKQTADILDYAQEAQAGKASTGLESEASIQAARAQALGARRQIVAARGNLTQARETLRALVGAGAEDLPPLEPRPLPAATLRVPDSLSFDLLARRPDLQALRWYVEASFREVDVARAAFYPRFDIKAFFGLDTIHINNLFDSGSRQFNIIPGVYLPIFSGGRLRANLRGARALSDQIIEEYNQSVLNAVRDVALSGNLLQTLLEERRLQMDKLKAAAVAQDAAENLHWRGLVSRVAGREARLPVITEEASLLYVDEACITQEIALIRALGGGYRATAPATAVR